MAFLSIGHITINFQKKGKEKKKKSKGTRKVDFSLETDFTTELQSYQYMESNRGDKTVIFIRLSYLHNRNPSGNSYTIRPHLYIKTAPRGPIW